MSRVLLYLSILSLLFAAPIKSLAQTSSSPFQTHIDMGFLGFFNSMEYHLNGQRVESYSEFKKIIYPLNDPEASRLIREAEQTDFDSWILLSGGLATSLDVALVYSPIILFHVDWEDRVVTFLATAQISLGVWDLVHNAAEARKYNAVQRYNHLIERRQEDADAWQLEPSLYACKDGLVLGEKLSF